ncbi:WW [Glarea lozoyensis ATCC 20868]|uniref:WW n=1 Tax=Glarea lozoyensis (strain ATCC 20868 / MF5171) TaxID=1116229 RepID=S3CY12_GLAL2|nr:WW [Glarea lozoyensis ATCC 20868]EPE29819.1 WW [Glarea lozoyensis ATCC 20868]
MVPYQPLDSANGEIRLLDVHPAKNQDAALVCKLRHAYLSNNPDYECLSYVWGREEGGTDIDLDQTAFRVFENCEAALRNLRQPKRVRTLWIDAICINQRDNDEKGAQVRRMEDIYRQARQVCIWLGELTDGSIVGVKSIQKKLTTGYYLWKVDRKFGKPTLPVRESLKNSISLQNRSSLVAAQEFGEINELLDRPWFTRVWIMQEAILARKLVLICGSETIDWHDVGSKIKTSFMAINFPKCFGLKVNPWDLFCDETYQKICHFRHEWESGGRNASLYQLLYDYRHLDCKMPQDRIYGFLGLAPMAKDLGFEPNYNLEPATVFTSFARTVIEKARSLDVLHCVREWRSSGAVFEQSPAYAYSLLDQSRYHDLYALIKDAPEHPLRRGWARLPPGWERIQDEGQTCYFRNHNDGTYQEQSPLEGKEPVQARYYAEQKILPRGWIKNWNNVGQAKVMFAPDSLTIDYHSKQLKRLEKHGLDSLPSWVPNWEARTEHDPTPLLDWADASPRYWASGNIQAVTIAHEEDPNI